MGTGVVGRIIDAIDIGDEDALSGHVDTNHFPRRQVAGFHNWEKFVGHGGDDIQDSEWVPTEGLVCWAERSDAQPTGCVA